MFSFPGFERGRLADALVKELPLLYRIQVFLNENEDGETQFIYISGTLILSAKKFFVLGAGLCIVGCLAVPA